ncbi:hypothetical protein, partial [Persicitalea sp.]|uniref:hypothetical protein n=1 Tax=Persicitalea sp. TaxID=3100273 RepID=UPI003594290C
RIRILYEESDWLLEHVLGFDFDIELAIRYGRAALDDLQAMDDPTDDQIEEIFSALANLRDKLLSCLVKVSPRERHAIENLTDRIDIFIFHHRL